MNTSTAHGRSPAEPRRGPRHHRRTARAVGIVCAAALATSGTVTLAVPASSSPGQSVTSLRDLEAEDLAATIAGRGITHSEQAMKKIARMHGIQSWVGLPHAFRKTAPSFEHFAEESLPTVELETARIRVLAGNLDAEASPIPTFQELTYLDIAAEAGCALEINVDAAHELAVYVCEGEIAIGDERVERFALAKLSDGEDKFVNDFIAAWTKVMNLDRFDLRS